MNSTSQTEENVADPFAADIFAAKQKPDETAQQPVGNTPAAAASWTRLLKKATAPKVDWGELRAALPRDFAEKLLAQLSQALKDLLPLPPAHAVELLPLVKKEINRAEDFPPLSHHSWWLSIGLEQTESEFCIEFDNGFAAWLVDAALGETVSERVNLRELTETETAVLEFLALNLIYEANQCFRAPLFKVRSLERQIPFWLETARKNFAEGDSILAVNWQTVHGLLPSIVRIFLAPQVFENLSTAENMLLRTAASGTGWKSFLPHAKDARARIRLGQIELTIGELDSLEAGDVVLLENYNLNLFAGNLFGRAEIFLGEGENLKITGEILSPEAAPPEAFEETARGIDNKILAKKLSANQTWQAVVTALEETEELPDYKQTMTETDENTDETGAELETGGGLAVENLALTLRVELEARRLTLAEIADLRENQIIELGVRPTDPVNLLIENRVVGRGELVEIEERLGVRITKLLK